MAMTDNEFLAQHTIKVMYEYALELPADQRLFLPLKEAFLAVGIGLSKPVHSILVFDEASLPPQQVWRSHGTPVDIKPAAMQIFLSGDPAAGGGANGTEFLLNWTNGFLGRQSVPWLEHAEFAYDHEGKIRTGPFDRVWELLPREAEDIMRSVEALRPTYVDGTVFRGANYLR